MRRKVYRDEMQDTVVNLIDLHFSVGAAAFMLRRTPMNIYTHLRNAGRMNGRAIVRRRTKTILDSTRAAMRVVCTKPEWLANTLQTASAGTPRGSATRTTFRRSAKKAA